MCGYEVKIAAKGSHTLESQVLKSLLDEKDKGQDFYADSAHTGQKQEEIIEKFNLVNKMHEKGYRGNPLTEEQKENNKKKLKTRARDEHIFGFMEQIMNGLTLKSIGIKRANGIIGLINLTYNLFRFK